MTLHAARRAVRRGRWIAFAVLALSHGRSAAAQRTPVPLGTRWPSTSAIAIVERKHPVAVEATSDGWVVLTPVGAWAEFSELTPTTRLQLTPSGVRRWISVVRVAQTIALDTTTKKRAQPRIPQLGRGLARLVASSPWRADGPQFYVARCDGMLDNWTLSTEDLSDLLMALERAAQIAEKGSPRPIPPTLDRPYYASELSCAALPMVSNAPAQFPNDLPAQQRRYAEVGVRFIVDTSGYVETGSVAVLPGAPLALDRAARALVSRWRYRPAVRGGAPVRQVIATSIIYDPARPPFVEPPPRVPRRYQAPGYDVNDSFGSTDIATISTSLATTDGWVQVRVGTWNLSGAFSGAQEWFSPDSLDAWAARALAYVTTDSARVRRGKSYSADHAAELKHPMGNAYEVRFISGPFSDTSWAPWAQMRGCNGAVYRAEAFERSSIERFVAAAKAARAERASPREPTDSAYRRGEVACPAILPEVHALQEELNVWRRARGPMPRSMEAGNARAEVLTSFVVDATGAPKASTLVAMPGSDPRAVAALRASLERYRFQPAMRSGMRVSARVMRNWSFEPRPQCQDTYDGLDCPRVYSHTGALRSADR